ncbi:MAG: ABC transporter substrate-binding protein [Deltaproteobacteria bacterium]|nr:ABC transporter substrate-binding protein [Deltaproteobacteria bacterium]MBI2500234.1 ABC transporter substrate-binding protein [Deltaproteobacteria bacterium]MBI4196748.1 ABC transporter substrate-binding protein [Deltaproteobacteria bacterium]
MPRLLFFLILTLVGCQKKEDRLLHIYSSLDAKESREIVESYEKASGERLLFVRLSTGEVLARIRNETSNPQVAVWIGGGSNEHVIAGREGLLHPYQPKIDYQTGPEFHGKEWEWNGWYKGIIGFASNTDFLKENDLKPPHSYRELLHPVYQGRVGMAYAYTSGTAYTVLASLIQLMGEEKGFQYIRDLNRSVHHYNKSGSACVTQAGLGEIAVCIAFAHDILHKGIQQGYPLTISYPEEGTGYEVGAVSLIKNGPGLDRAKKFVDWLYSLETQNLLSRWNHIPLHPKAEMTEQAKISNLSRLVSVDIYESAEQHNQLLSRWREVTGQ